MHKITKKQFVVCKDYKDTVVDLIKGDVVLLQTAQFVHECDETYKEYLDLCHLEESMTVEVVIFSREEYLQMLTGKGSWNPKFSSPLDIRELPALFHCAKILPRNFTLEVEDFS